MASPRKTPVTAFSVPVSTRDDVNLLALDLSSELGRRVSMAAVLGAAVAVARAHRSELLDALRPSSPSDPADPE